MKIIPLSSQPQSNSLGCTMNHTDLVKESEEILSSSLMIKKKNKVIGKYH